MYRFVAFCAVASMLGGCTGSKPQDASEINLALDVAAAAEGVYASGPHADPKMVAQLSRLLASAQAAFASWQASSSPADQAAVNAAISALVAYEASAGVKS